MKDRAIEVTHVVSLRDAGKGCQRLKIESDGELLAVLDILRTSNKSHRIEIDVKQRGALLLVNENPKL